MEAPIGYQIRHIPGVCRHGAAATAVGTQPWGGLGCGTASLAAPMSRSVPLVCGDAHPALGWVPRGVQGGVKGVQEELRGVKGGSGEAGAEGTAPLTCATACARPQTHPSPPDPRTLTPKSGQHSPKHIHRQNETAPALASMQPQLGAATPKATARDGAGGTRPGQAPSPAQGKQRPRCRSGCSRVGLR